MMVIQQSVGKNQQCATLCRIVARKKEVRCGSSPERWSNPKGARAFDFCHADRLIREPVDAVTVTSLIKEVGCNRSTFYYYFADTEQLAEAALDAVVPVEIPQHCSRSSDRAQPCVKRCLRDRATISAKAVRLAPNLMGEVWLLRGKRSTVRTFPIWCNVTPRASIRCARC